MFILARNFYGYTVAASDRPAGRLSDLLFDDHTWDIRRLAVGVGTWLRRRTVLLPPDDVLELDSDHRRIWVDRTADQVAACPPIETFLPVARRKLLENRLIAWDGYWSGVFDDPAAFSGDPRLRNTWAVTGHRIEATDGLTGRVADFLIDADAWKVRYLLVDHGPRGNRRRVLLEPRWVEWIRWEDRKVHVALSSDMLRECPDWSQSALG